MAPSTAASNNGMHPAADTKALIFGNRSGRRVMPGVRRSQISMEKYECCICKETVSSESRSSVLDPCALLLIAHIDQPRENHKEQQFYCHFECFRKLVNDDGIMYIMDIDAATIGEIEEDAGNWAGDDGRA